MFGAGAAPSFQGLLSLLHSDVCELFGPYFAQGSLISHGYPWTLPPGWQGGFCMPQVLGTMRSRTLEEGGNSLLMGSGR